MAYITDVAQLQNGKLTEQTVELIRGLEKVLKRGSLLAYLVHMTLRIVEIHRVLKPTGSFYLHCDPTASHYLKLICDTIFVSDRRGGDFLNEIIWSYRTGGVGKKWFSRKHDCIFLYAKSADHQGRVFNVQRSGDFRTEGLNYDEDGRPYKSTKKGRLYFNADGPTMTDVWEIPFLSTVSLERLGYPTQKPEALLERVIAASTNEGDIVLDAYCGCGTTVAVAQRLNRRWIGIDITYQSISLILRRFKKTYKENYQQIEANIHLDGVPRDIESAVALANRKDDKTRKEFEKWAVLTYSDNQARINEKKGADAGIDGIAYFHIDAETNGKAIFQVKSGGANRSTVATLNSDRQREKAEFGILLTMDPPTKAMREEVIAAGKYKHPLLQREDDRIQIVTVQNILDGIHLDLPMARTDAVKSAKAIGSQQPDLL